MLPNYREVRDQIVKGNVKVFRCELIHVLYKKYIMLVKSFVRHLLKKLEDQSAEGSVDTLKITNCFDELFELKRDFSTKEFPLYKRELTYLEQLLKSFVNMPVDSVRYAVEKDARYKDIVSDSRRVSSRLRDIHIRICIQCARDHG